MGEPGLQFHWLLKADVAGKWKESTGFYTGKGEWCTMVEPVDVIRAFHNAFRNDLHQIDTAALDSARGKAGLGPAIERYRFMNEMLVWHAEGEEAAVFPAIEVVAPLVAEAYEKDHRYLDAAFDELHAAYTGGDPLRIARASAAFRFHLDVHLNKEELHLYRIFRERVPLADQWKILGVLAGKVPKERYPEMVTWLVPLNGNDDRETMVRVWQANLPPPAFAGVKELAKKAAGNDWAELQRRIPGL